MTAEAQADHARKLAVAGLSATVVALAIVWLVRGCGGSAETGASAVTVPAGRAMTFQTGEVAPESFDAWTFFWEARRQDAATEWEIIVLGGEGEEYWRKNLSSFDTEFTQVRSDFTEEPGMGNPAMLFGKHIKVTFQVSAGAAELRQAGRFRFEFYRKTPGGEINWQRPFKTIRAVSKVE